MVGKVLGGNKRWAKYFVGNATGRQSTIDQIFLVSEGIYRMYQKTWQLDLWNFNFYGHPLVICLLVDYQSVLCLTARL